MEIRSLWKSIYTGQINEAPQDFTPKYSGWEFMGFVEREKNSLYQYYWECPPTIKI